MDNNEHKSVIIVAETTIEGNTPTMEVLMILPERF